MLTWRGAAKGGHGKVERGHRWGSAKAERGHRWCAGKRSAGSHFTHTERARFLFSPLTAPPFWPPKREYNAVSAIADEIWQYRTGGNLTIFDKDHDTAEEG